MKSRFGSLTAIPKYPARALRRRSALVDETATRVETAAFLLSHDPVMVFSMGKAGTTALEASILAAIGRPVMKAHALTSAGISQRFGRESDLQLEPRPRFLWRTEQLRLELKVRRRRQWDVVTAVREPVARAASAYFYGQQLRSDAGLADGESLADEFHTKGVLEILRHITVGEDWFRDEFEPVTGIDVYANPFPVHRGAAEYESGRFRALLVRAECPPGDMSDALSAFFGVDWPPVERANEGRGSVVESAYSRFLASGRLPEREVENAYSCRLARHFYSSEELDAFRERWIA